MYTIEKGVLSGSTVYFNTPSNLAKSMFFYPLCVGHFLCDEHYEVNRGQYTSYLIMYVLKGSGKIIYDSKTYEVTENSVVLLNCYQKHYYATTGWEIMWLHFDGNVSEPYFDTLFNRFGCVLNCKQNTFIASTLEDLLGTFANSAPLNEALISCVIQRLLSELFVMSSDYASPTLSQENTVHDTINLAIHYMKHHFHAKVSLADIAQYVALSPYHFSRLFKRETGYSPYEYLTMLRLNESKYLLKNTSKLIKEIAFEVGFASETNFITCFKNNVGYSPTAFRNLPL